jgi:hypothetical protein
MKGLKPWEEPEEEAEKWTFAERVQVCGGVVRVLGSRQRKYRWLQHQAEVAFAVDVRREGAGGWSQVPPG